MLQSKVVGDCTLICFLDYFSERESCRSFLTKPLGELHLNASHWLMSFDEHSLVARMIWLADLGQD